MKVGDIRMEVPSVDSEMMLGNRQARRCEVVWIHPQWRFYTVEFTTDLGWKFRESYFFADKRPDGPPLPEHVRLQRERAESQARGRGAKRGWHNKPKIGVFYAPA